jgi:signal transduction histidine kinase/CheY-like chemotaxis protein
VKKNRTTSSHLYRRQLTNAHVKKGSLAGGREYQPARFRLLPNECDIDASVLAENLPYAIVAIDKLAQITWGNASFFHMVQRSATQVLGQPLSVFLGSKQQERLLKRCRKVQPSGYIGLVLSLEGCLGHPCWIKVRSLLASDDKISYLLLEDITLKHLQDVRLRKIQQEQRAQQEFVADLSHEIRNLAHTISGMCQLLDQSRDSLAQMPYVAHLKQAAGFLSRLTDNMLSLSKMDGDRFSMQFAPFDLRQLLDNLALAFSQELNRRNVHFELVVAAEVARYYQGDEIALYQILLNLLSNAAKFTAHGKVVLSVRPLAAQPGQVAGLEFRVSDTGIGIAQGQIQQIFSRYRQGDHSLKHSGAGLGLAIVKELVRMHTGQISVQSEVGQGACFTVFLPLTEVQVPREAVAALPLHAMPRLSSLRVLIVEDDTLGRVYLEQVLMKVGVTCRACAAPAEALDWLEQETFDLIFIDLNLADGCGRKLAQQICQDRKLDLAVFAISAVSASELERCALDLGLAGFLSKPFKPQDIYDVLRSHQTALDSAAPRFLFSPEFDASVLQSLYSGELGQVQLVFHTFLRTLPVSLDRMDEACRRQDWHALGQEAHKTKPSFAMIGLGAYGAEAQTLERCCQAAEPPSPDFIMVTLESLKEAAALAMNLIQSENKRIAHFMERYHNL